MSYWNWEEYPDYKLLEIEKRIGRGNNNSLSYEICYRAGLHYDYADCKNQEEKDKIINIARDIVNK